MKIKYSIKVQFAATFISLLAGTILLCWFINTTFLEKFYIQDKQAVLLKAYDSINEAIENGSIQSEEFDQELQKICEAKNLAVIVIDAESQTIKSTSHNEQMMGRRLFDNFFGTNKERTQFLQENKNYVMNTTTDPVNHTEYIEMWGVLNNGNMFMIRTALEGIRDSVSLSNRFLAYVGIWAILVGAVVTWFVSKRITKPIMELAKISESMTELDFDAKYQGKEKNEIGLLGEHINQLSETLEHTISELKTANNELQKDIEKKEKIDEMRKEFLSNVSHELKTPIALIQGYAEGLKVGINNDDAESRDFYCDVIMDESGKMNNMVKKLLDLNHLEFGNDVVTMERFDIISLITTFLQSAEILTKQNNVQVRMDKYAPTYVWADEFKTEEVFRNYFSNAMNHVDGDRVIEVKVTQENKKVRVSVFNTGEPIPEDSISFIWDKFYKVDKARTREYGGSGVGLSIVKAIMTSMNQQYGVMNYQNGVEFWFELETN